LNILEFDGDDIYKNIANCFKAAMKKCTNIDVSDFKMKEVLIPLPEEDLDDGNDEDGGGYEGD